MPYRSNTWLRDMVFISFLTDVVSISEINLSFSRYSFHGRQSWSSPVIWCHGVFQIIFVFNLLENSLRRASKGLQCCLWTKRTHQNIAKCALGYGALKESPISSLFCRWRGRSQSNTIQNVTCLLIKIPGHTDSCLGGHMNLFIYGSTWSVCPTFLCVQMISRFAVTDPRVWSSCG